MTRTSTFHKTGRSDYKKKENQNSLGSIFKESLIVGTGVSIANEVVNRVATSIFGARQLEVVNKSENKSENRCEDKLQEYKKCIEKRDYECKSEMDSYEKCLKTV
jgi:hypothetical protein